MKKINGELANAGSSQKWLLNQCVQCLCVWSITAPALTVELTPGASVSLSDAQRFDDAI